MTDDRVGLVVPPPAYPLGGLALAWLLQKFAPLPPVPVPVRAVGTVLLALAAGLALWAAWTLLRHRTPIDPYRPTTTLVQTGPFRRSRNPIYVAFIAAHVGLGLAFAGWWALPVAPFVALALARVVRREEQYLARKFGPAYDPYLRRTRRWL
jgi:protein-S-isoprenylcysteine O-methyltransferase Ste14